MALQHVVQARHVEFLLRGQLSPGSQAWIASSDRAGKDNLRPVDAKTVLRKREQMEAQEAERRR